MFYAHEFGTKEAPVKFRPLQDYVVLRPIKARRLRGIELPDNLALYGRCEVMAVGPGFRPFYQQGYYSRAMVKTELHPGQFVFIQRFVDGEVTFRLNGDTVFLVRERHLNLTIEGDFVDEEFQPAKGPEAYKPVTTDAG